MLSLYHFLGFILSFYDFIIFNFLKTFFESHLVNITFLYWLLEEIFIDQMITSKSYPLIQFWHPLFENIMCNSMSNHQMVDTTILQVCFKLCTLVAFIEKRKCEKFWSSITALELLRFKFKPFFLKHGSICSGYFVLVYFASFLLD